MSYDIDRASFGRCPECGDEIVLENITHDELLARKKQVLNRDGTCDLCDEGITRFDKQARHQILQWLGPVEYQRHIASVVEPHDASYALVTLEDGRAVKIFRRGESSRDLPDEIDNVFTRQFPDLQRIEKPWRT